MGGGRTLLKGQEEGSHDGTKEEEGRKGRMEDPKLCTSRTKNKNRIRPPSLPSLLKSLSVSPIASSNERAICKAPSTSPSSKRNFKFATFAIHSLTVMRVLWRAGLPHPARRSISDCRYGLGSVGAPAGKT